MGGMRFEGRSGALLTDLLMWRARETSLPRLILTHRQNENEEELWMILMGT